MRDGFIKVAAGTPQVRVADTQYNAQQIIALMREADGLGVKVLALPELCLTGYTCGDLFLQDTLLDGAMDGLRAILRETAELELLCAFGMPVRAGGKVFNCAAVVQKGEIVAVVPKTYLPNYGEFYEKRWFACGESFDRPLSLTIEAPSANPEIEKAYTSIAQTVIDCEGVPGLKIGIEICEDLWSADPPSRRQAAAGATLILNLSASNELAGKAAYRRELVKNQSARLLCAYVYADAGEGESTTDLVFCGHDLIAENGAILAERRFGTGLVVSEIDVQKLIYERRRMTTFAAEADYAERVSGILCHSWASFTPEETALTRPIPRNPFVPAGAADRAERCEEILQLQTLGLKKRMEHAHAAHLVVGVSGGLDSTLAMLVSARALAALGLPAESLIAVTMPCFGTTGRTKSNAMLLAEELGAELRVVDIGAAVKQHFADIGHDMENTNVVFENAQARERTQVIMDIANGCGGLVVGTGDMSELALGWATYNGDHMSMYGVNAGVPKTLVRHLVDHSARAASSQRLAAVLRDILDTPVSPELLPAENGEISQKTEDLVGPYELHDFFLYYLIRWGFGPKKVLRLAEYAFSGVYDRETILKWLRTFIRRFFQQQFKRSCLPDGPKVGTLALSPRGDWRMPSDACADLWLAELA
jgi:NAD+ synthase (glutamine-hydrolysing)